MKIFDNVKLIYSIIKTMKSYEHLTNTKHLTDNQFSSVSQNIKQLEKSLSNSENNTIKVSMGETVDFLKLDIQFIKNFIEHNFEESFKIALSMKGQKTEGSILNRRLDALMEIKARISKEEFQEKYNEIEIII